MLKKILRDEFGFKGITISDANSLYETIPHGYCESFKEAGYRGVKATMSLEMASGCFENGIPKLLEEGRITMEEIDDLVRYNLYIKYVTGIMDDPFMYFDKERIEKLSALIETIYHATNPFKSKLQTIAEWLETLLSATGNILGTADERMQGNIISALKQLENDLMTSP